MDLLDTLTHNLWLHFTIHYHTLAFSAIVFIVLLDSSFQWRMFLFLWVPEMHLSSATATLNWLPADSLLILLYTLNSESTWTDWLMEPVLIIYSLDMENTENTVSNSSSIVA
jgi:hypothetical protein